LEKEVCRDEAADFISSSCNGKKNCSLERPVGAEQVTPTSC
jgi:hypothetical protein